MASEYAAPAAPQTQLVTNSNSNAPARVGAYVDTNLTTRNIAQSLPTQLPPKSGATTLGSTRAKYAADQLNELDNDVPAANASASKPAQAPNKWAIEHDGAGIPRSRDPYRNNGMVGQSFFQNQG